jgi:hypothetical protein
MAIKSANHQHVLKRYCELGGDNDQQLQFLQSELYQHESDLRDYNKLLKSKDWNLGERLDIFQDVQASRAKRTACLVEIRRLNSVSVVLDDYDEHVQLRTREFERICGFRQIISAFVDSSNAVNFVMRALYNYKGVAYDLGDWVIAFGVPGQQPSVEVKSFRRTVKPSWETTRDNENMPYPDYIMSHGDFCLGTNSKSIHDLFDKELFSAGIELIIGVVSSVNEDDVKYVPDAFNPYIPIEIGGVSWPLFSNGPMRSI